MGLDIFPASSSSSLIFITSSVAVLVVLVILRSRSRKESSQNLNLPPGSFGWPFLGETLQFLRSNWEGKPGSFVKERMEKYKTPVFKTSLMGEPVAVLCGPAGNKFLFGNENKLVQVWWPTSTRKLLGNCLSTSVGDEAKQIRKMLSHFVSPDALMRLYIKAVDLITQQHIKTHWQGS